MFKIIVDTSCDLDYDEGQSKGIMCQPIPYFLMYDEHLAQGEYRLQNTEKNRRARRGQGKKKSMMWPQTKTEKTQYGLRLSMLLFYFI